MLGDAFVDYGLIQLKSLIRIIPISLNYFEIDLIIKKRSWD